MGIHVPRKRFGQNFLRDSQVIQSIIHSIAAGKQEHLVEIGPGEGVLTQWLMQQAGRLDLVEIDRDLVALLRQRFPDLTGFNLHQADALRFDFSALAAASGQRLRIVGNLPYNISTPLMFHLLEQADCIEDMHFMLQKEVVDRLCASPGDSAYGRLGVMAQYHCSAEALFDVDPSSFYPAPKVMSSVVRLVPHRPARPAAPVFARVVAAAFNQRRKTLHNALKGVMSDEQLEAAGVSPAGRAERLSLDDFLRMAAQIE